MRDPRPLPWLLIVAGVNGVFIALAALFWGVATKPLPAARFEYGVEREWTGAFQLLPYPSILVGGAGAVGEARRVLLVAPGKHGAAELVRGLREDQSIAVRGSLMERDGRAMIETGSRPTAATAQPSRLAGVVRARGPARLQGEIVDSKCFLGVMNPGSGKVHRGCAARCLSGGVPPILYVPASSQAPARYVLLAGPGGEPLRGADVAQYAAEPVSIDGELFALDDHWLLLRAAIPGGAIRRRQRE